MSKLNKFRFLLYVSIVISVFSSCFNEKKITYFQKAPNGPDSVTIAKAYTPRIQQGDILSVYVNSLSPEASSFFNPYSANTVPQDASGNSASVGGLSQATAPGFLVDVNGNIELPMIGSIPVTGLTILEAHDILKKKLEVYLKEPTVIVRFLNYKISILGEVNKPGVYVIPNEKISLPEALSVAGDVTNFAKRNEIQVIREVNSRKEFAEIDLTSRDIFSSPYYYLHANDIIYVKAGKTKVAQNDIILRIAPLVISAMSLLIVLIAKL